MGRTRILAGVIVAVAAAISAGHLVRDSHASTGTIPLNCDRACLEGVVNRYLAALVAHDPTALPVSRDCPGTRQLYANFRRPGIRTGGIHGHHV
jgi:hypothetical protein